MRNEAEERPISRDVVQLELDAVLPVGERCRVQSEFEAT